jgi:hypothetical protein
MAVGGRITISTGDAAGTPVAGRITIYAKTDGIVYLKDENGTETALIGQSLPEDNTITLQNPNNSEDVPFFYTQVAITVTKLAAVVVGSATPSVTRHSMTQRFPPTHSSGWKPRPKAEPWIIFQ